MTIQRAEGGAGYRPSVVGCPASNDRRQSGDDRSRVRAPEGAHLGGQPSPDPLDGGLAGFDEQLAVVAADVESQEVESLVEVDDARLVLVEGQTPGRQPFRQSPLDLVGLFQTVA